MSDHKRRDEMNLTRNCLISRLCRNGGAVATAAAVLLIELSSSAAIAQQTTPPYGRQMMWDGGWGWHMVFGPVFMILMLAAVIAVVVLLVRWLGGPWYGPQPPHQAHSGRTPLDILKERFARGEIDKDEFEERRRVLSD
jgi:putative membrane protein